MIYQVSECIGSCNWMFREKLLDPLALKSIISVQLTHLERITLADICNYAWPQTWETGKIC